MIEIICMSATSVWIHIHTDLPLHFKLDTYTVESFHSAS